MANYNFRYDDVEQKLYFLNPSGEEIQIGTGEPITIEALSVTENGTYTAQEGKAYTPVTVNVPQTIIEALTATENNTYTAPEGKAYSPVTVNIPQTIIEALSVTENGTYTAQEGKAYSPVNVNVPSGLANVVNGSFKLTSEGAHNIEIPYSGSGNLYALLIVVKGDQFADLVSLVQKGALQMVLVFVPNPTVQKTFNGGSSQGCIFAYYKSTSSGSSTDNTYGTSVLNDEDAGALTTGINKSIRIRSDKKFSVYASNTAGTYGVPLNFDFEYYAIYYETTS